MAEVKHMQMVSLPVHSTDGLAVEYGPGELHEPGSLPEGVPYTDVLVTDAQAAWAPVHAQQAAPKAEVKAEPKAETKVQAAPATASGGAKSK